MSFGIFMKRLITCLFALWCLLPRLTAAAADRPNVLVLLADDAGWGDYSGNGNEMVRTPNIDSLAKDGVRLERFYVCPVCSPTRAEFLTGRYHPRGGVRGVSTGQERLDPKEKTIADAFKAAGYATGAFGKWHNGSQWPYHPLARGFDEYFGYTAGHWGEYFDPPLEHNGQMGREKGYIVDICTDKALEFIEKNKSKPFFCYVPFTTPHSPWSAPEKNWQRFKDMPLTQKATDPTKEVPDETRCALAMVENQDMNVGRILQKLKDLKLSENTIVLYFSDNGPNSFRWNGGMKGKKATTDEGGVRSIFYMRWPGKIPSGHRVREISGAIDLLPTLTSLAGISRVGNLPLDGRDLTPLLRKQASQWPDRMIFSTWAGKVSVRTQQYRLDDQGKLYDMVADPGQTTPINDKQSALATELTEAVKNWRSEMFSQDAGTKAKGKGGNAVDPRPFTVGYKEFPITMLPARDGDPRGGVKRSGNAPNCSYFVNWTTKEDSMVWYLDVHTTGKYAVTIDYTCPIPDAGSLIELSFNESKLTGKVAPGWDPPLNTNQDTIPRGSGESQMKEFKTLKLGEVTLNKGLGHMTLKALEIPGKNVMDVRRITLTLLD